MFLPARVPRTSKYTRERLAPVVAASLSMGKVLDALGLKRTGGNYRHIRQRMDALGLDTSHFLGQAHNRGKTMSTDAAIARVARLNRTPDAEVFRRGSTYQTSKLGKRLRQRGVEYACTVCGLRDWRGDPITLHVDHVNGDTSDARLCNLRFLCPNCHQQTRTWGSNRRTQAP